MPACQLKPKDKKAFIGAVGKRLEQEHGMRKYYPPTEVRRAVDSGGFPIDFSCWAYCFFCSQTDFIALHAAAGESCDYLAMKAEVVGDLASSATSGLNPFDLSSIDWPDFDFSSCFDWIDFS